MYIINNFIILSCDYYHQFLQFLYLIKVFEIIVKFNRLIYKPNSLKKYFFYATSFSRISIHWGKIFLV